MKIGTLSKISRKWEKLIDDAIMQALSKGTKKSSKYKQGSYSRVCILLALNNCNTGSKLDQTSIQGENPLVSLDIQYQLK